MFRRLQPLLSEPGRRRDALFLLALCLGQAALLSRTAPVFFDGDAFFYFAHPVESPAEVIRALTSVDAARQYRPLGGLLVGYVFRPLFGLNHSLYWAAALLVHLVNTILVFVVLRRLLKDDLAIRVGTLFWAFNPVAIYVTHSFSFLPDFSYAFFYLCAVLAFFHYRRTGSRPAFALVVILFGLSLLSKELAVTLPAALVLITLVFLRDDTVHERPEDRAQRLVWTLCAVLLVYLGVYARVRGGDFYDASPTGNYFMRFGLQSLLSKADYWLGALYLPLRESLPGAAVTAWPRRLTYVALPLLFLLTVFVFWPPAALARRVRAGVLWSLIGAGPVLFLAPEEFSHNLYVPALGLAVVVGLFWHRLTGFCADTGWLPPRLLHAYGLGIVFFSLLVNQKIFESGNWRPYWERMARTWVDETRRVVPELAPPKQLYVLKSSESGAWNLYNGELLRVFYDEPGLKVGFDDERDPLPRELALRGEAFVVTMLDGHVHDVTAAAVEQTERPGISLVDQFSRAEPSLISGARIEGQHFDTPTGGPVFVDAVLANSDYRRALVTLGGVRVRLRMVATGDARLSFGVTKRFEAGDGVVARVYSAEKGERRLLYERRLDPRDVPSDRRWFNETIELGIPEGQTGVIELECDPGPHNDASADWLAWSGLSLEGAHPL